MAPTTCPGDYLYFNGIDRRITDGAWGIIRVLKGRVTTDPHRPELPATAARQHTPGRTRTADPDRRCPAARPPAGGNPLPDRGHPARGEPHRGPGARGGQLDPLRLRAREGRPTRCSPAPPKPSRWSCICRQGECVTVAVTNQTGVRTASPSTWPASPPTSPPAEPTWAGTPRPASPTAPPAPTPTTWTTPKVAGGSIADLGGGLDKQGLYGAYTVAPAGSVITDPASGALTDVGPRSTCTRSASPPTATSPS